MRGGQFSGDQTGSPRQRHPRAAVSVVVHEKFFVQLLGPQQEARIAMRTETDRRADHAIPRGLDKREIQSRTRNWDLVAYFPRCSSRRATADPESGERGTAALQKCSSIHRSARIVFINSILRELLVILQRRL